MEGREIGTAGTMLLPPSLREHKGSYRIVQPAGLLTGGCNVDKF